MFQRSTPIVDIVERHGIEEIIVAVREQRGGGVPMDELLACRIRGIPVLDLAAFYERAKCEVPTDRQRRPAGWSTDRASCRARSPLRQTYLRHRHLGDVAGAGVPADAHHDDPDQLDSPGPVIYRQERVGLAGRSFMCLKFRSMRSDAEKDGVACWATKNDSRATRVDPFGKTRIDELPQLISVLKGEMSMVGRAPSGRASSPNCASRFRTTTSRHSIKPA